MARAFRWQPAAITRDVDLARSAGLEVQRAIVVDDELRSSVPGVYAVGECAQHRDVVYGLWAPLLEQARVAGGVVGRGPRRIPRRRARHDAQGGRGRPVLRREGQRRQGPPTRR
jgi:Pyridine nucleotide-disulphide oxidoreductase